MSTRPAPHPSHQGRPQAARRQGLRQRRPAALVETPGHEGCHPEPVQPQAALQLRQECLQATTPHRERLLPAQGLPPYRHSLRQAGAELPRLHLSRRRYRLVDFMSLGPTTDSSFPWLPLLALPAARRSTHGRIEIGDLQVRPELAYKSAIVARGLSRRPSRPVTCSGTAPRRDGVRPARSACST